jgi:hypothetical protein
MSPSEIFECLTPYSNEILRRHVRRHSRLRPGRHLLRGLPAPPGNKTAENDRLKPKIDRPGRLATITTLVVINDENDSKIGVFGQLR